MRFYEFGIQRKLQEKLIEAPIQTIVEDSYKEIEINQMWQLFCIPMVGLLLASTVIAFELVYVKLKNTQYEKIKHGLREAVL